MRVTYLGAGASEGIPALFTHIPAMGREQGDDCVSRRNVNPSSGG